MESLEVSLEESSEESEVPQEAIEEGPGLSSKQQYVID